MTRATLHRVATHVLGRRRFDVTGRFGLRATPGGFGTPAFGTDVETVRVSGLALVREVGGAQSSRAIPGATLRELASFVDADVESPFSAGDDAPPVGEPDALLEAEAADAERIAAWFALGWRALDVVMTELAPPAEASTIQLWPEHFDAGTTVTLASGARVNLGFSPGDGFESGPYAYVGPWDPARAGDPSFWNAPFGAARRAGGFDTQLKAVDACVEFLQAGLRHAGMA